MSTGTRPLHRVLTVGILLVVVGFVSWHHSLRAMKPASYCGQFALRELLLRASYDPETIDRIMTVLGSNWLTTSTEIVDAAMSQGVQLEALDSADPFVRVSPFIAWYGESHFVVVESFNERSVLVADNQTATQRSRLSRANFLYQYGGVVIVFKKATEGEVLPVLGFPH